MMFYFLESAMKNSFYLLSKEQRYAIRSLFIQVDALNDYMLELKELSVSDHTLDIFIDNGKRYLFTGSSMLNTIHIIVKDSLANESDDDEKIINSILKELNIDLCFDDLMIKKNIKFTPKD